MSWVESLTSEMEAVLETSWSERSGTVVPESESVTLKDGAVKIEAVFMYADLAGSSSLAKICPWQTTTKVIRAYLDCCVRSIKVHGGEIRSFDGDRVMAVFKNDAPSISATNCAREIDWMVENVLNKKAGEKFKSIRENNIKIKHCVGIDVGDAVAVRAGIRNNNDLIWIGKAPSFAAKLSDVRNYPFRIYITKACHDKLPESSKKNESENIWEAFSINFAGESCTVYATKHMLRP